MSFQHFSADDDTPNQKWGRVSSCFHPWSHIASFHLYLKLWLNHRFEFNPRSEFIMRSGALNCLARNGRVFSVVYHNKQLVCGFVTVLGDRFFRGYQNMSMIVINSYIYIFAIWV